MTEAKALETTVKSFLVGVSVGTLLAMILKPRDGADPREPDRDIAPEGTHVLVFDDLAELISVLRPFGVLQGLQRRISQQHLLSECCGFFKHPQCPLNGC